MKHHFISVTDPAAVTVEELRRAATRVGSDLAVVAREGQPIVAVHSRHLDQVPATDPVVKHLARLTSLEDAPLGDIAAGARVAIEPEFAIVVRQDDALLVPTPGDVHWEDVARSPVLKAYAAMARLPGEIPEPPDAELQCTCRYGDIICGPASNPPRTCVKGHPVICQ